MNSSVSTVYGIECLLRKRIEQIISNVYNIYIYIERERSMYDGSLSPYLSIYLSIYIYIYTYIYKLSKYMCIYIERERYKNYGLLYIALDVCT